MAIAGKGGKVVVGTATVAEVGEWSLDINSEMLETTKFLDDWKSFIAGLKDWSGSFSGRWDMTDTTGQKALQDAILGGTSVTLKLYVNGTNYYTGTAFISTESPSAGVDGLVEVSFDVQGSGALTYA